MPAVLLARAGLVTSPPHRPPKYPLLAVLVLLGLFGPACGGDSGGPSRSVATVTVSAPSHTTVPADTLRLIAAALDASGTEISGRQFTWTSSNLSVATVVNGTVTGVAAGNATIKAITDGVEGSVTVNVRDGGVIGPAGGTVNALGVILVVPPGGLAMPTALTVSASSAPPADPWLIPASAFDFGPAGTTFTPSATLTIGYAPGGVTGSEAALRLYKVQGGAWQLVAGSSVNATANTVTGTVTGFSTYAVLGPPFSAAQALVTVSSPSVASGSQVILTLQARDAAGSNLDTTGLTVVFTRGAGTSDGVIGAVTDNGDGTYSAAWTATAAGTARTIGATINGAAVTTTLPTITVTPGPVDPGNSQLSASPPSFAATGSTTLTLLTRDTFGNNLTSGGLAVLFTLASGTGVLGPVTDHGDGSYSATLSAATPGLLCVGASINGISLGPPLCIPVTAQAASTSLSVVSVSPPVVGVLGGVILTLQAKDANGADITSGGLTVVFTKGSGTSDGTIGATVDHSDGTYTASLLATTPGTPRTIGATIDGVPVSSTLPTLTVVPPGPSPSRSLVTVSSPTAFSGAVVTLTLQAKDFLGLDITTGGLTVDFIKSGGPSDGTIGPVTDNGDGTYTATFTATTAGGPVTIGATMDGTPVTSVLPTITVAPGPIAPNTSEVMVSAGSVPNGSVVTLTLLARDAFGNALHTGGAIVVFTKGAGTSDGTIGVVTDHADGTYTATFTATSAGSARTIGATINGGGVTTPLPTITVQAAPTSPTLSTISVTPGTIQSGAAAVITLTARDINGTVLSGGGLTVAFALGAGTSDGTIGPVADHTDGTYSATFTGSIAGTPRVIGGTIDGAQVTSSLPTVSVTPGPTAASTSVVSVATPSVQSGGVVTLTLTAHDAAGNRVVTGGSSVLFTTGTGTSNGTIGAVTDHGDGTYTASFSATTAGTALTIGATIGGVPVTTTLPTITVTPGAANPALSQVLVSLPTVVSGSSATLTLRARDAEGNNLTSGGLAVAFTKGGGTSDGVIGPVTDHDDGSYTASFTGTTAGSGRTIGATMDGTPVSSALPTIAVTPGPPNPSQSQVTVSAPTVVTGGSISLTLTTKDAAGNPLTSGGHTVLFTKGGGTSDGSIGGVTDPGDGTYSATFTATTPGSARTIGATIDGQAVTSALPTITVSAPPSIRLSAAIATLNASQGGAAAVQPIQVLAIGGNGTLAGLSASVNTNLPANADPNCKSVSWLTTAYPNGPSATPYAQLDLTASPAGLNLGTCVAKVTVTSATPALTTTFDVTFRVARGAALQGVRTVVLRGNSNGSTSVPQQATAQISITNGGRGILNGLSATVLSATGFDPANDGWLTNGNLTWTPGTTASTSLVIQGTIPPFGGDALVQVSGNGINDTTFAVQFFFDGNHHVGVTPATLTLHGFAGGASVGTTAQTTDDNSTTFGSLGSVSLERLVTALPWLQASLAASTITVTADPALVPAGNYVDTLLLIAAGLDFAGDTTNVDSLRVPVSLVVEPGLELGLADVELFAPAGGSAGSQDLSIDNGGNGTLVGLQVAVSPGATWLTAGVVGGVTTTPTTLRLGADAAGHIAGTVLNATVTITATSPAGTASRQVPVSLTVY